MTVDPVGESLLVSLCKQVDKV